MEVFDENQLRRSLQSLAHWKRVAFMLLCCERMLPNFQVFSNETGFGDTGILRKAANTAWEWVATAKPIQGLTDLRQLCGSQQPDTEDFSSPFTSAALDAASATEAILEAIEDPDGDQAVEVGSLA